MSALSAGALQTGAVITFHDGQMVISGAEIVEAAARLCAESPAPRDHWLTPAVPVLSRSDAWIVPLFWMPEGDDLAQSPRDQHSPRDQLRSRAGGLGQSIISACRYAYGEPLSVDFDGRDGPGLYSAELARTGAATGAWWAVDDQAIVLVYHREHEGAPVQQMALHVVPVGWVSARRATKTRRMPRLDLAWSWSDVVGFAAETP